MKRIIICADGTWNDSESIDKDVGRPQPTNVLKVARAVLPKSSLGIDQIIYYHEGVGTGEWLDKASGGVLGSGMSKNVRALYRFIVYNFELGDEIFLFGFSRGAFTVRTLAGFMNKVGLLHKDDEYFTSEIYELYQSSTKINSPEWQHAFRRISIARPCPSIKFIGVWDTVGALGAPGALGQIFNRNKYKFHDIGLNPYIQSAFHALAIDERRKSFAPSLWNRPMDWHGALEQVWFPGVHSNVGGGYSPDGLANEALHWMLDKAEGLGLEFDRLYLQHYLPCFNSVLKDSMTFKYKLMGSYVRPIGQQPTDGEAIHQSAIDRMNLPECHYNPQNLRQCLESDELTTANTQRIPRGKPCIHLSELT